jgi:hypothetical protein
VQASSVVSSETITQTSTTQGPTSTITVSAPNTPVTSTITQENTSPAPAPPPPPPTSTTESSSVKPSTVIIFVSSTSYFTSGSSTSAQIVVYTSTSVNVGAVHSSATTPTPGPGGSGGSSNKTAKIAGVAGGVVGGVAVLGLAAFAGLFFCLRRRRNNKSVATYPAGQSPAPLIYSEPKPSYPTPPVLQHRYSSPPPNTSPSPTGGYYQAGAHSPSELSGSSSPPLFSHPNAYQGQQPIVYQPPQGAYANQGFQVGRAELGSNNLPAISEMGTSYTPHPQGRY